MPERAIQWRDTHQNSTNLPAIVYELDTSGSPVTMIHLKHESKNKIVFISLEFTAHYHAMIDRYENLT